MKEAQKKIKNCHLKIALIHHPLSWLHPGDFSTIRTNQLKYLCSGGSPDLSVEQ